MWDAGLLWVAGGLDSGHFLLGWKIGVGGVAGLDCGTRSGWDVKGSEMGCGTGLTWPRWVVGPDWDAWRWLDGSVKVSETG